MTDVISQHGLYDLAEQAREASRADGVCSIGLRRATGEYEHVGVDSPVEFVAGRTAPEDAVAAAAVEWHDELAVTVVVARDGRAVRRLCVDRSVPDDTASADVEDRRVGGPTPDGLRRWLGLGSTPPSATPAEHLVWLWLDVVSWGLDATETLVQADTLLSRPDRRVALRILRESDIDPAVSRQVLIELLQPLRALPTPNDVRAKALLEMLPTGQGGADFAAAALLQEAWLALLALSWEEAASIAADVTGLDTSGHVWDWMDGPMRARAAYNRNRNDPPRDLGDVIGDRAELVDTTDLIRWVGADLAAAQPDRRMQHRRLRSPTGAGWALTTFDDGDLFVGPLPRQST